MTAPDLVLVQQRIKDVLQVLGDFSSRRESGRTRAEYKQQLVKDLCLYYNYNEYLIKALLDLFPSEVSLIHFLDYWACVFAPLRPHLVIKVHI